MSIRNWDPYEWVLGSLSVVMALITLALIAGLIASAFSASRDSDRIGDLRWRGINRDFMTCAGGSSVRDKKTCVSGGVAYLCLLNRDQWLYDCAPDGTPAKVER